MIQLLKQGLSDCHGSRGQLRVDSSPPLPPKNPVFEHRCPSLLKSGVFYQAVHSRTSDSELVRDKKPSPPVTCRRDSKQEPLLVVSLAHVPLCVGRKATVFAWRSQVLSVSRPAPSHSAHLAEFQSLRLKTQDWASGGVLA